MTLESWLISNVGLMVIQQEGYFGHFQMVTSHYDLYNSGFKVIIIVIKGGAFSR